VLTAEHVQGLSFSNKVAIAAAVNAKKDVQRQKLQNTFPPTVKRMTSVVRAPEYYTVDIHTAAKDVSHCSSSGTFVFTCSSVLHLLVLGVHRMI
jgi:hypothetical protein